MTVAKAVCQAIPSITDTPLRCRRDLRRLPQDRVEARIVGTTQYLWELLELGDSGEGGVSGSSSTISVPGGPGISMFIPTRL